MTPFWKQCRKPHSSGINCTRNIVVIFIMDSTSSSCSKSINTAKATAQLLPASAIRPITARTIPTPNSDTAGRLSEFGPDFVNEWEHFIRPVSSSRVLSRYVPDTDRHLWRPREGVPIPTGGGIIAFRRFPEIKFNQRRIIYAAGEQLHVLLTVARRGTVSFPKGGMKIRDGNFVETAQREFYEETGIRTIRLLHQTKSGGDQPSHYQRNYRYLVALCTEPGRNDLDNGWSEQHFAQVGWQPPRDDPSDLDPVIFSTWAPIPEVATCHAHHKRLA